MFAVRKIAVFGGTRGEKYILYEMERAGSGLLALGRSACGPRGETGKMVDETGL